MKELEYILYLVTTSKNQFVVYIRALCGIILLHSVTIHNQTHLRLLGIGSLVSEGHDVLIGTIRFHHSEITTILHVPKPDS